jgi:hypothetical protein
MDNKTAKATLLAMNPDLVCDAGELDCRAPYMWWHADAENAQRGITLDGTFTFLQLEALAAYARDPKGVSEA